MDIRIQKTRAAIINTFIELRSKNSLEKITVRELCQKAQINKSTFYSHYEDIYALSNEIEDQIVVDILKEIKHPELVFQDLEGFNQELFYAFLAQSSLINTLFKDNRRNELIYKIKVNLKKMIFKLDQTYEEDPLANIILDYVIYGGYYTFMDNINKYDTDFIIHSMGELYDPIWNKFKHHFIKKTSS